MTKIQELSERLANQITAGGVVERPASVVEGLVGDVIDTGDTQIDILVEETGLRTIQVIDNGEGTSVGDIKNTFKRHVTGKIHNRDDLFRIRALGPRREALSSIVSVFGMTLETTNQEEKQGAHLLLKNEEVIEHWPAPLRQRTKITVSNLFFNMPACLKYVKTLYIELANIGDIVNRLVLSHPSITLHLIHDGNKMLTAAGNSDLKQATAGVYGLSTAKKVLKIEGKDLDFELSNYVSLPEMTRASRNYLSVITNRRFIKNFSLDKTIVAGYGSKLMAGHFSIAVSEIKMDPLLIDVNVHPTEQKVRLSRERELTELISSAIQGVLSQKNLIPSAADNPRFKKKVSDQLKTEQIGIDLSYVSGEEEPKKPNSLNFGREAGTFFMEELKSTFVDRIADKSVGGVENYSSFSEKNTTYPGKTVKTVDKFGKNVDNFTEKAAEKLEKKEFPIVGSMEKTSEEQTDKSVKEDEEIYEEELTPHPELDPAQGDDETLE